MAGPALTDVPDRYDVVFSLNDGTTYGFLFADSVEGNLPFRTHKALYSYSPTFLERQNLSAVYGDNFQDFFLTGSQNDFSEGENQKFFRVNDADRSRRYWAGLNVNPTSIPGNTTLAPALTSANTALTISAICPNTITEGETGVSWWMVDNTNLYKVGQNGTVTTVGAHGAGSGGVMGGICVDSAGQVFISGATSIRKYNGVSFATFSGNAVNQLLFLNNVLFGYQASTDSLISFDTAGTPTTQFQWKGADGATLTTGASWVTMMSYGGAIYIVRKLARVELWVYDGAGVRKLGECPDSFAIGSLDQNTCCVNQGIVFLAGYSTVSTSPTLNLRPQVYYYVNGSMGKLWESPTFYNSGSGPHCAPFENGIVFSNPATNTVLQYDLGLGGVHTIANPGFSPGFLQTSEVSSCFLMFKNPTSQIYGYSSNYASTGNIQTSQYDFDNTLNKVFRSIKVDADIPANSSIDLAYQVDGVGGAYTNLQTGASSGTEYPLPANTNGHSISVRVTLNSATGSATPTLKRVYVRAAPTLQQFRRREFLFDLSGGTRDELGKISRRNRDLTAYPVDALTACKNLIKIATQTIPFTVADRFAPSPGMTALADLQQNQAGYDGFAIYEVRPNVFIGRLNIREV